MQSGDVIDDYEVVRPLAEGGMAELFIVKHTVLGSIHVLKRLRPECVRRSRLRKRFLSEGRVQAQLRHRHIVAVTDLVSTDDEAALIMDLLEGGTLSDRLSEVPQNLSPREAARVLLPLLDAMQFAHSKGVVHRDIKPDNVIFRDKTWNEPCLSDFGIAKVGEDADIAGTKLKATRTGVTMGTPGYMAPEQIRGSAKAGPTADIFALGVMLWEMVVGVPPFLGNTEYEVMDRIVQGVKPDLEAIGKDLPVPFRRVIERAIATDPNDRYKDCVSFARALRKTAIDAGKEADRRIRRQGDTRSLREAMVNLLATPATMGFDDDGTFGGGGGDDVPEERPAPQRRRKPDTVHRAPEPRYEAPRRSSSRLMLWGLLSGAALAALGAGAVTTVPLGGPKHPTSPWQPDHVPAGLGGPVVDEHHYELVEVEPASTVGVGSPDDEVGRADDEPLLQIVVPRFAIGTTEVTQSLWERVMGDNPNQTQHQDWGGISGGDYACDRWGIGPDLPVSCVTWVEAIEFCNALSAMEGLTPAYDLGRTISWDPSAEGYRLPTEAEWELAARSDLSGAYAPANGLADVCGVGNVAGWYTQFMNPELDIDYYARCKDPFEAVAPVSSLDPSPFGVFDTVGNVAEWVWDPYDASGVAQRPVTERRKTTATVHRGGDWTSDMLELRTANREFGDPTQRSWVVGLRLARSL